MVLCVSDRNSTYTVSGRKSLEVNNVQSGFDCSRYLKHLQLVQTKQRECLMRYDESNFDCEID